MTNYIFFIDSAAADNNKVIEHITSWAEKNLIFASLVTISDNSSITTALKSNTEATTYVAVGLPRAMQALIANARLFDDNTVIGYIPLESNDLGKKLGLKNYKDACKVIAQRKLVEVNLFSINQGYLLYDYTITNSKEDESNIVNIKVNDSLDAQLKLDSITIESLQNIEDSPLQLNCYSKSSLSEQNKTILKARNKLNHPFTTEKHTLLRLPFRTLKANSSTQLSGVNGQDLGTSLEIGTHKKSVRLIIKRGHINTEGFN